MEDIKNYILIDYKIIIINDITKKNNALRLNKYLKYKLEEENIKVKVFYF